MRMLLIGSCICVLTPQLVNNLRRVGHMALLEMCHWGWTWRFQKSHTGSISLPGPSDQDVNLLDTAPPPCLSVSCHDDKGLIL